ncbi:hypothetical protein DH2020_010135 [Rehmannia glutinosa]|uniref:DNA-directed RNA polymerase III subunit RPC4 n=1 Tax=Rehmannia glutinosa TaxID=99300 RepID=A0ABR0X894_REHGL
MRRGVVRPMACPEASARWLAGNKWREAAAEGAGDGDEAQQSLRREVNYSLHLYTLASNSCMDLKTTASEQVAFDGAATTGGIRTFGKQKERTDASKSKGTVDYTETLDDEQNLVTSISTEVTSTEVTGVGENSVGLTNNAVIVKKKKEYEDPWDYNSYYPTTIPFRRPNSGDPEELDKAEFEEAPEYDENSLLSASELGLLDQDDNTRMLFFKFPSILPGYKSSPPSETSKGKEIAHSSSRASKGKEISESSENPVSGDPSKTSESSKISGLEDLPKGYIGKMLVYKSGDVKLKLGDILYDVSPGCACIVSRHVMAMNTDDRHCSYLGDVNQRAVVTPEVDSLLDMI